MGNSVRGVQFCEEFTRLTESKFHMFNRVHHNSSPKSTPKLSPDVYVSRMIHCASTADVEDFKKLVGKANLNLSISL